MANVKVRYIGGKPIKRDTVCNTLAVWPGRNSVTEVPQEVAVKLLQFPTVWIRADDPVPDVPPAIPPVPVQDSDKPQTIGAEKDGGQEQGAEEGAGPVESKPDTELRPDDEHGFERPATPTGDVTVDEVVQVFPNLDKEADFSEKGRPIIANVRSHFPDRDLSLETMKAAWDKFKAAE